MFAEQVVVGHAGDVVADDDVARFAASGFLVRRRHGVRSVEVEEEKFLEAADGAVTVFGDGGMIVDVLEEKTLETGVLRGAGIAESGKAARGAANVVRRADAGLGDAVLRGFDEVGGELIEDNFQSRIELEFFEA